MGESTSAAHLLPAGSPDEPAPAVPTFAVIYERYFDLVWSAVRQLGVSQDAIDDVVQEVFVVIHAKLPSLERVESLRSWVYGVTRRTVSTYRRAQRSRNASGARYAEVADWLGPLPATPLDLTERAARQRLLLELLAELEPQKREVFALAEIEGFTAPEMAEALDIPLNTVYSRLRAARQAFELALARHAARQKGPAL
ncbi:MAG: polymerase sigma factor RpoE [Polyangiaceae bacterium]|jgi:RNA polymerase sigma-70 factor (ECF subfamily)|nr:polymerase sigma factor RpoE [Polyangiaceae bacterium]